MILFMHVDHTLPMLKTPTLLHLRVKAQVPRLAAKALHPPASPWLLPAHCSPATLASLLCLTSEIHSCLSTPALDVPSLCGKSFSSELPKLSAQTSIVCEASTGHLRFPSAFCLPSQLHSPRGSCSPLVRMSDTHCLSSLLYPSSAKAPGGERFLFSLLLYLQTPGECLANVGDQ